MRDWEPIVELRVANGVIAVCRGGDGWLWLTSRATGGDWLAGTGLEGFEPVHAGLLGGMEVAGRLPPGATRVELRDAAGRLHEATAGGGAWVAMLDGDVFDPEPVVLFRDDGGNVVPRPRRPGEYRREPVVDADEPCPACGGTAWDEIAFREPWDEEEMHEAVACRSCGHEEATNAILVVGFAEDEEPDGDQPAAEGEHLYAPALAPEQVRFAVFGVTDAPPALVSWASADGVPDAVELSFELLGGGVLCVETSMAEPISSSAAAARQRLASLLEEGRDEPWPDVSEAALHLRLTGDARRASARADAAPARRVTVPVDGRPVEFAVAGDDRRWAAVATPSGPGPRVVAMSGRDVAIETVELRQVDFPLPPAA